MPVPTFQILPNKSIRAPDGSPFVARGVTMFDYLLASFDARTDYDYRSILNPPWAGPDTGVSEPTYFARTCYRSTDYVEQTIAEAWSTGVNMIRVAVEPAVQFATSSYVDPVDGQTYPDDMTMLGEIIATANAYGMVVQLQMVNDNCPVALVSAFMTFLAGQFGANPLVWINPWNEPNGMPANSGNVNSVSAWLAKVQPAVQALRDAGWINPIAIDPPGWASRIDLIAGTLTGNATFSTCPNLVVNIHYYPAPTDTNFLANQLPAATTHWFSYAASYCLMIGEAGINATGQNYDLNLNGASVNPTQWAGMQAAVTDFLKWCCGQGIAGALNGVIGESWFAYIPGHSAYDLNTMRYNDDALTTWGAIFQNYLLAPRATTVLAAALAVNAGALVNNSTVGTPPLQATGISGNKAAAMMITNGSGAPYVGFHNVTTGLSTGAISGNGGGGVNYVSASDYRLKTDVREVDPGRALSALQMLHPVFARWKDHPDQEPELIFLAHELQAVVPSVVTGEKDGEVLQGVDYGRLTPLLVAALQALADEVNRLRAAIQ